MSSASLGVRPFSRPPKCLVPKLSPFSRGMGGHSREFFVDKWFLCFGKSSCLI